MDKKMSLVEHLQDLRKTFIYSIIALTIGSTVGYLNIPFMLNYFKKPLPIKKLVFFSPAEAFLVNLKIALLIGFVLAFPVILSTFAWFIAPGLTKKEKKIMSIVAFFSTLLFILGSLVAYYGVLPLTLKFLFNFSPEKMVPYISISYYVSFIINFIIVFGLSFQFPFIIIMLTLTGVVSRNFFKNQRKYIILSIISLSFILAPGTDIVTQCLLFGPLYLLFEITIFLVGFFKPHYSGGEHFGSD